MIRPDFPNRLHVFGTVEDAGLSAATQLLESDTCGSVEYHATIESTNTLALSRLSPTDAVPLGTKCGDLLPRLCMADQQTAGRGRHGRTWIGNSGTLTFSLTVPRPTETSNLTHLAPLAVGVGIARYLEFEFAPTQVRLKWPNDVHVGGGKVAGILMETSSNRSDLMVIGVGINVGERPELESGEATERARGLAGVLGRSIERYDLLAGLVDHLVQSLEHVSVVPSDLLVEYRSRCMLVGQEIEFQDGAIRSQGHCLGISDSGGLLVETSDGQRCLHSGEANLIRSRS